MNPVIQSLIELQEVLSGLAVAERRQREVPLRLETLDRALAEAARELGAARDEVAHGQKERRHLEMEVASVEALIKRHQDQTLAVKSNEAYRALQHEIEQERAKIRLLEDQILLLMERSEELAERIKILEREHGAERARVEKEKERVGAESEAAGREIEAHTAARTACEGRLPAGILDSFRRIVQARGGVGIARARDERCGGCNVRLRPQVFQELRDGEKIFTCDSCHRFLYVVPEPRPAPAGTGKGEAGGAPPQGDPPQTRVKDEASPAAGLEEGRAPAGS
jgi:hypothetical protein